MAEVSQTVHDIKALLKSLAKLDVNFGLVRTEVLGAELDFSDNRTLYEDIQSLAEKTADLPWENITDDTAEIVHALLRTLRERVREINSFSPQALQGENVVQKRDEISSNTRDAIINLKRTIIPLVGFLVMMDDSDEDIRSELKGVIQETRETSQETLKDLDAARVDAKKRLDDIEGILAAGRRASGTIGGEGEARTFREAANRYEQTSRKWLKAALAFGALTIGGAFLLFWLLGGDGSISEASVLQRVLAKGAALAVLTYATVTAIRLYRSNVHLAVVNRHREDALQTFQAFAAGATQDDIRDKILLAATHAAFGQTPTGLVSDRAEGASSVEVLDGIWGSLIRKQ